MDNDPQPTTVILSLANDTVTEGSGLHFPTITRDPGGGQHACFRRELHRLPHGQHADSPSPTSAVLFTPLRIEAGQSSGTATLYLSGTDDDVEDEDETVTLEGASDHPGLRVVSHPTDNCQRRHLGSAGLTPHTLTVREGERQRYYIVSLATEPTADVVVTVDVPANAGFTVSPGSITFTPQSWGRKYVFVEGIHDDDSDDEPAAQITHSISSSDTLYRDLSAAGVSVTVRDDDDPLVEVSFGAATYDRGRGRDRGCHPDPERGPGAGGDHPGDRHGAGRGQRLRLLRRCPPSVTFAGGETEKTVTITAIQDTDNDDGESVKLGFGTLPDRVTAGTTAETTVSITDDDVPDVKVSFAAAAYPVSRGRDRGCHRDSGRRSGEGR